MKQLRLAFHRLAAQVSRNRLIFVLFCIGMMLSLLSFIYFYGNLMPFKINEYSNALHYRQFVMELPGEQLLAKDDIAIFTEDTVQDIMIGCDADFQGLNTQDMIYEAHPRLYSLLYGNNGNVIFYDLFEAGSENRDAVILSKEFGDLSEIQINGSPFAVTKQLDNFSTSMIIIPPTTYLEKGFSVQTITYTFYQRPSAEEASDILGKIQTAFPGIDCVSSPLDFASSEEDQTAVSILTICLFFVVSLLSFLFLFKNLLEESSYEDSVYMITGASRKNVLFIIFAVLFITTALGFCITGVLHHVLYDSVFRLINIYDNIRYHITDYLIIAALSMVLSGLTALPFIGAYMRKTTIELKNQYKE